MSDADAIITELDKMGGFIDKAHAALQKGKVVGLSHLDNEVAELCAQAIKLPPEQAKTVQPIMADVISKLETLALSLQSFQAKLKEKTK